MTQLVAVIFGPSIAKAKEQIAQAAAKGADLVEIRLDRFEAAALDKLSDLPRALPLIFTFRKLAHGGACEMEEEKRLALFEKCLEAKPDYCDIETDTDLGFFETIKKKHPKIKIIGSFHNLNERPPLEETLAHMQKPHIEHYKLAVAAQSASEALRIMLFTQQHKRLTCIGLGESGQITRILAPLFGNEFCYAALDAEDAIFGQLTLEELVELYRFKTLDQKTHAYALIGHPTSKSVGHLFHNKSFPKDAVYVKIDLDVPELPLFFSLIRQLPFAGFSITMPLKELLGRFLTSVDPVAEQIGSVNTIIIEKEHWCGFNTDGVGALDALESHQKVKGKKVVVLGSGGSARAIAYEAIQRGAKVTVLSRTPEHREALAKDFGCEAAGLEELGNLSFDVLINSIPVDLIFDAKELPPKATVMDIVYWEEETPLLKIAKERGCKTIGGMEMFEGQARLQQKIWFKQS
jgi:3-dehydroquinate dehydratase/shikimate dehydrogenase